MCRKMTCCSNRVVLHGFVCRSTISEYEILICQVEVSHSLSIVISPIQNFMEWLRGTHTIYLNGSDLCRLKIVPILI